VARIPAHPLWLLWIALGIGCDGAGPAPGDGLASPRGVFLIVIDTLRADRLSCYGYQAHRTPHLDALADSGVRFARARAVASWTVPSMGALLTSRLPAELGLVESDEDEKWPGRKRQRRRQRSLTLPAEPATLATVLRGSGFRTAAFVDQPMLSPRHGFQRGFDDWFQPDAKGAIARHDAAAGLRRQTWATTAFAFESDTALIEGFEAWLPAHASRGPVFAWLHLLTPHRPYTPPASHPVGAPDPTQSDLYDAEIRAVDALVGRALAAIATHLGWENALVVLTSDHGEAFGEHGSFEHGNSLHREVLDVPLLLSAPGRLPRGRTIDALVRSIDVAPTLLAVVGVPAPAEMRGESLLPLLDEPGASRAVYAEGVLYGATERAYTEEGFKLLLDGDGDRVALYAIDEDPDERSDLAEDDPQRVEALRARMQGLRRGLGDRGAPPAGESPASLEALRALGYLEGAESGHEPES
jgi:arylsulfatase A-like enzyme